MGNQAELDQVRARARSLLEAGKSRDLSDAELREVEELTERGERLKAAIDRSERSAAQLRQLQALPAPDQDFDGTPGTVGWKTPDGPPGKRGLHPWTRAIVQHGQRVGSSKALAPSGQIDVPSLRPDIVGLEVPERSLLTLLPTQTLDGTSRFAVLRSLEPELHPAVVALGDEKPESEIPLEKVEGQVEVVAHHTGEIPRVFFDDVSDLDRFIRITMETAVLSKLEDEILNGDGSPDHLTGLLPQLDVISGGPLFTLARRAIGQLENIYVSPNAVVVNPNTAAEIDWRWIGVAAFSVPAHSKAARARFSVCHCASARRCPRTRPCSGTSPPSRSTSARRSPPRGTTASDSLAIRWSF